MRARKEKPLVEGAAGVLPNLIVIGAMKCGTSALHRYLGLHPEIFMSEPKELNFFCGPEKLAEDLHGEAAWLAGNWHRGVGWYAARFRPAPVRGESSPGYTSPSFPEAAGRMARVVPEARLVYAVRDPIERAVSQYRHHRADGSERRPLDEALLDPGSQYLERSRYHARLEPYLERFPREQILVCAQEDLPTRRRATLRELYRFAGVDDSIWSPTHDRQRLESRGSPTKLSRRLHQRLVAELSDDVARLRGSTGREFPGWQI